MFHLGPQELIIILIIVILLFGGRKIPEIMRGIGQGLREFKSAAKPPAEPPKLDEPRDSSTDPDKDA